MYKEKKWMLTHFQWVKKSCTEKGGEALCLNNYCYLELWPSLRVFCYAMPELWELDNKEGWLPKNQCFWVVLLKKTLESPLDYKEIKPVNLKENQCWIFIGKTNTKAEAPTL